jgi:hypothetical protein
MSLTGHVCPVRRSLALDLAPQLFGSLFIYTEIDWLHHYAVVLLGAFEGDCPLVYL